MEHPNAFNELADDNFNAMEAYEAEIARLDVRAQRSESRRREVAAFERWQREYRWNRNAEAHRLLLAGLQGVR